ncbi:hypothetical protein RJT34_20448 [Clitoria ternatea]|uniref:Uncharacterized protein n=1 Tax=Clitoria ternatea TaxID=43366 RepID=A0AAN9ISU2_CLITE
MLLKLKSLAQNATYVVAANNKQILKRKSTTVALVTNEEPSNKYHRSLQKKKKTSKFSAMPISEFLEKNNDHNEVENQLEEDEGDNQMEQLASQDSNQCEAIEKNKTDTVEGDVILSSENEIQQEDIELN